MSFIVNIALVELAFLSPDLIVNRDGSISTHSNLLDIRIILRVTIITRILELASIHIELYLDGKLLLNEQESMNPFGAVNHKPLSLVDHLSIGYNDGHCSRFSISGRCQEDEFDLLQVVVLFALAWMGFHELELAGDLLSIGVQIDKVGKKMRHEESLSTDVSYRGGTGPEVLFSADAISLISSNLM
ncbi:hypothetical protein Tco_0471446 [Tanacetum coccineum]